MVVRTLADLRKEDEQRNRDAETGEALPLIRGEPSGTAFDLLVRRLNTYII